MSGNLVSEKQGSARLAERRRLRRRRARIAFGLVALALSGVLVWGAWQEPVRISRVQIYGGDQSLSSFAFSALEGAYLGIIPRDSAFFFPADRIRGDITAAIPGIVAVSIFREGFTGLTIRIHERVAVGSWCGLAPTLFAIGETAGHGSDEYCYVFDANGYVFAADASTTPKINSFKLYGMLEGETEEPLRATIARADELPSTFDFARQIDAFGSSVSAVVIRGDEVTDILESGTQVRYVLGSEQDAFTALVSAKPNVNLSDGSVEYVDLRFDGKVYVKRRGQAVQ